MSALPLIDLMHAPPIAVPVAPDEGVVEGEVDETLILQVARKARHGIPQARIELHRDRARDLWMWSWSYSIEGRGSGYRVGPKWHNFADTRDAALHWARGELLVQIAGKDTPLAQRIRAWAEGLT